MPFTFADNPQLYSLEVSSSNILMIDDFEDGEGRGGGGGGGWSRGS